MNGYNKIMEKLWLIVTITIAILVTFMGFKEGFNKWWFYYFFALMTFGTYSIRKFMRKRMEKHLEELNRQANTPQDGK
jgi:predicted permease